ncbi:hypothetical protein [Streptomyces sp. NPDC059009]|uniref:hypothetical protein n=1 Tax=Streptomyces sp. NPDC059009 TaxID=3346694 RepID=UPI0036A206AB
MDASLLGGLPDQVPAGQRDVSSVPRGGPVEMYDEHDPIVYLPDPYDPRLSVAVRRSQLQAPAATQPRDLKPVPLIDPGAQKILATGAGCGAFGAGLGWGIGQILGGLAGLGSGVLFWLAVLVLVTRVSAQRIVRGGNTYVTHNHNSWWGHSTTRN